MWNWMERHSFARIFMNIYLKVQYVLPNKITYETKNDLISINITKPSSAYTDLTHFTVWLNQISLSQIKEHETRFGWKFCERCSRSYQAVVLHSRLMGITVRTNLGFPVENRQVFVCMNLGHKKNQHLGFLEILLGSHWSSSLYSK